jgi:hypothetical protein
MDLWPTNLRRLNRHIALGALLSSAVATGALLPVSAPAISGHARPASRRNIARVHCTLERSKKSSNRGRTVRVCAKPRVPARKTALHPSAGLEATPVNYSGPGAPAAAPPAAHAPVQAAPSAPVSSGGSPPVEQATNTGVLNDPIDPKFLTELPFGTSSFWIQPWRAYLDTWPSSQLLSALGINFNVAVSEAEDTAKLLQDSGFKLARIGMNWGGLSYTEPTRFGNETAVRARLLALRNHGLRPLILLDANSLGPTQSKQVALTTLAAVPAGAQTVTLSPASAAAVVPGKTGFDALTFGGNPDVLITSVGPGNVATLSRPLLKPLEAGAHAGTTLLYAPFPNPTLPNGSPNPVFQETLAGWLSYVSTVTKVASSIFGPEGYDLEIWNELSFGSQFLNAEHYYSPNPETEPNESLEPGEKGVVSKLIVKTLLDETISYLRSPTTGVPAGVGITDGFASQTPFPSGANAPTGLTALSKHLYTNRKAFPASYAINAIKPINALGERDSATDERFSPLFVPTYQSLFPEFYLTATNTETVVRDIAPLTTNVYGFPHGRNVGPAGSQPVQKWMTEYNLGSRGAVPMGPDGVTPQTTVTVTAADKAHFDAKALLRSLVAMVNKGMTREYFYAASAGELSLVSPRFMAAVDANPTSYPGDQLGGETMDAFRAMLAHFQGPGPGPGGTRQLQLLSVAQNGNHAQFTGDSTTAHPNLYDREVLAVLPFQSSPTQFVIPVYVMTRDLLTLYEPNQPSSDTHRYDLPNETFRITLSNLPPGTPTVTAYDPLRKEDTPAHLLTQQGNTATFELAATDYPRLLTLTYPGS